MNRNVVLLLACIAVLLLAVPMMAAGPDAAAIYKSKCAMCHGPDGAGQTSMGKTMKLRDLGSADVQKVTDAEMTKMISDGKGKMPGYKAKLTTVEIDALVAFIRKMKK